MVGVVDRVSVLLGDCVLDGVEVGRDLFDTADLDIVGQSAVDRQGHTLEGDG